jgi:hypothetical protein
VNKYNSEIMNTLQVAKRLGLGGITPAVMSRGAHLILHLYPYPIVARVSIAAFAGDSSGAYRIAERELRLARYLDAKGIPVLKPAELVPAGPHDANGAWLTLWDFIPPMEMNRPAPEEAFMFVTRLTEAMRTYSGTLPVLGVWNRASRSAARLEEQSDTRIRRLLGQFHILDEKMRSGARSLQPCHGDAHAGNLLAGPDGWLWSDFEDASLMPPFWDMASYAANLALFGGHREPVFAFMQKYAAECGALEEFYFAIKSRILMSTLGNLDFALQGRGDLAFAARQLELAEDFIKGLNVS